MTGRPLLAGIELGGTKCVCLVGTGPGDIRDRVSIPTGSDPRVTLGRLAEELHRAVAAHGPVAALGIASFGPIELSPDSPAFGSITTTTKPGWSHSIVASRLAEALGVPVGFDTDVNGAALAEARWGAARGLADLAYVTVGTGIGVGLIVNNRPVHGFLHPELGHIRIARRSGDDWRGACVFHGDCVEGLASGTALGARTGMPAHAIPPDHAVWEHVAYALSQLLHTVVLGSAPRRILLGGGVMQGRPELFGPIRRQLAASLNGYPAHALLGDDLAQYVVPPGLGELAGPLGGLALALERLER